MKNGNFSVTSARSWQGGAVGAGTSTLLRHCHRRGSDDANGRLWTATRIGRSKAETRGTIWKVRAGSAVGCKPNEPLHVTAARVRLLLNLNGYGGAAARDRRR